MEKHLWFVWYIVQCTHVLEIYIADFNIIETGHQKNVLHAHGSEQRLEPKSTLPNRINIFNPFLFIKNNDYLYPQRVSPPLGKKRRDMFLRAMLPIQSGVTDSR